MNGFFDGEMLLTYSGVTLAVTLVTEFLKGIRWLDRIPTRIVSYAVALAIMLAGTAITHSFEWGQIVLIPVNAVVVALAANGSYDAIRR